MSCGRTTFKTFKALNQCFPCRQLVTFLEGAFRKFTLEELRQHNGQDGKPAYIAFKGKVYDVSLSSFWMGGDHLGAHQSGMDLTEEINLAPHGEETLERLKVVGVLA